MEVFSEYYGFPCHSFHRLLHIHRPSPGAGTVAQTVATVPSGLILPHHEKLKKKCYLGRFQRISSLKVEEE
jgi:hypothetical protein